MLVARGNRTEDQRKGTKNFVSIISVSFFLLGGQTGVIVQMDLDLLNVRPIRFRGQTLIR